MLSAYMGEVCMLNKGGECLHKYSVFCVCVCVTAAPFCAVHPSL